MSPKIVRFIWTMVWLIIAAAVLGALGAFAKEMHWVYAHEATDVLWGMAFCCAFIFWAEHISGPVALAMFMHMTLIVSIGVAARAILL